jgi:hypothetical protein
MVQVAMLVIILLMVLVVEYWVIRLLVELVMLEVITVGFT